jgi:hypothetical protein
VIGFVLIPWDESLPVVGPFLSSKAAHSYAIESDAEGETEYALEGYFVRPFESPKVRERVT